jgi:hypothetical protein
MGKERAVINQRRFKQLLSLSERLEHEAPRLRAQAESLPTGRGATSSSAKRATWKQPSMSTNGFHLRVCGLRSEREASHRHPCGEPLSSKGDTRLTMAHTLTPLSQVLYAKAAVDGICSLYQMHRGPRHSMK